MTFSNIGSSIMKNTDYNTISNKKYFSKSGGIGSDDWIRAKEKKERM
jgi:hypothetical protein